jgi:GWxTD domain-containing protein
MFVLMWLVLACCGSGVAAAERSQDWSASAEAAFLTREELAAWKTLRSDDDRERFKVAYWQRRDPTPGTDRNEFKETILSRIRSADSRFAGGKKHGSETARGRVFVVLGAPSVERQTIGPLNRSPEMIEISFIVEPGRGDRIERGDIFERWREKIARRSIVNPEAVRNEHAET